MRDKPVQSCSRCGLPQSWEITKFDKAGVCNYCRFYDSIKESLCDFDRWVSWDLPQAPDPENVDRGYYGELLLRAAVTVLEPLEVKEETLRRWLLSNAGYGAPPGVLPACQGMPMFMEK